MPAKSITTVSSGSEITQREDARDGQVLERVHGGRFERVDLLGHAHRAELRADARADAARHAAGPP